MLARFIYITIISLLLFSCGNRRETGKTSLYKYGIPVHLSLPDKAKINPSASGDIRGLTIVDEEGYNLQIIQTPTSFTDKSQAKFYQRELIVNNPDFVKIIEDYDDGFLFELKEGDNRYYDFRFVKIMGTNEIIFQAGPTSQSSESQVRNMIISVLEAK